MKKVKRIAGKNIGVSFSFIRLAVYWLLWDRVHLEWFRTLIIIWLILDLAILIYSAVSTEVVDIFEETK